MPSIGFDKFYCVPDLFMSEPLIFTFEIRERRLKTGIIL